MSTQRAHSPHTAQRASLLVASCLSALVTLARCSHADDAVYARSKLQYTERNSATIEAQPTLRFTPVTMSDGSRLTLIAPSTWSDIVEEISLELTSTHQQLTTLFGTIPAFRSSVRLLDEPSFFELTGAPKWTNAMFFRGEIVIPLSTTEPVDMDNLRRSVKHEYSHAVFSALSGGLIPGWLDEGLAQWIEGEENPALRNSLRSYLTKADPVPLALLQGGFTKLAPRMVAAAYAQSLIAVQALLKAYGVESIGDYLRLLKESVGKEAAFEVAFGLSERDFEARLNSTLRSWSGVSRPSTPRTPVIVARASEVPDRATRSARKR